MPQRNTSFSNMVDFDYEPFTSHGAANLIRAAIEGVHAITSKAVDAVEKNVPDFETKGKKRSRDESFSNDTSNTQNKSARRVSRKPIPIMSNPVNNGEEVPVRPVPRNIAKTIPTYFTVKLPYCDSWAISTATSHASEKLMYKVNDVVDPLHYAPSSSGAHQPMGFDKYTTIWNYYRVIGSTWKVTAINALNQTQVLGLYWNDDASDGITTVTSLMESKYSMHRIMCSPTTSNTPSVATCTYNYSPSTLDHHVREADTETRWTQVTNSPSVPHYLQIQFYQWKDDVTTSNFSIQVFVEAEFIVQFIEPQASIYWDADDTLDQTV